MHDAQHTSYTVSIGVNAAAAGVAGVATHQYLTRRGRPVLTTSQYFDKCFIFSLQRNFGIPQVAVIIPAKARDYAFTGVGLSVCLSVCLLPR